MSDMTKQTKATNVDGEIPVAELRILRRGGIDLPGPGNTGKSVIKTSTQANRGLVEIFYVPRLRHHRVTCTPPGDAEPETLFVHETACTWIPAKEPKDSK